MTLTKALQSSSRAAARNGSIHVSPIGAAWVVEWDGQRRSVYDVGLSGVEEVVKSIMRMELQSFYDPTGWQPA